jgi:hypothetical protein
MTDKKPSQKLSMSTLCWGELRNKVYIVTKINWKILPDWTKKHIKQRVHLLVQCIRFLLCSFIAFDIIKVLNSQQYYLSFLWQQIYNTATLKALLSQNSHQKITVFYLSWNNSGNKLRQCAKWQWMLPNTKLKYVKENVKISLFFLQLTSTTPT